MEHNAVSPAIGSENEAISISQNIQQRHMPHGTILDPVFKAVDSDEIDYYARGGDSASAWAWPTTW